MQLDFDYGNIGELHENTQAGLQWVPAADTTLDDIQQAIEERMDAATKHNHLINDMQMNDYQRKRADALSKKAMLLQKARTREKQTLMPAEEMQDLLRQKIQKVIIYTDGSHKGDDEEACCEASWAFVVVYEMDDGSYRWRGFAGGKSIPAKQEDINRPAAWVGVDNASSMAAEGEAIVWAMLWWLQSEEAQQAAELIIESDNLVAGKGYKGLNKWRQETNLNMVMRSLAQIIEQEVPFSVNHVYSHQGHPWNEMADTVATAVRKGKHHSERQRPTTPLGNFRCDLSVIPWAWMHASEADASRPQIDTNGDIHVEYWTVGQDSCHDEAAVKCVSRSKEWNLDFAVGFANVLTLNEGNKTARDEEDDALYEKLGPSAGLLVSGKVGMLQKQMQEVSILGIAEARTEEGSKKADGWYMIASGRKGIALGCEAWFNLERPVGRDKNGNECFLKENFVRMLYGDPRRLLIALRAPWLECDILVLHAPHSGHSKEDRDED